MSTEWFIDMLDTYLNSLKVSTHELVGLLRQKISWPFKMEISAEFKGEYKFDGPLWNGDAR